MAESSELNFRSIATNFISALAAQGITVVTGVIMSILVPKVLGVESFGYWQLFIFYSGYIGFFHFGLCDGFYLKEGGKSRSELNWKSVNAQLVFCVASQFILAALMVVLALMGGFGPDRSFVLIFTGIFLVLNNTSVFVGYLFQVANEIKNYSKAVAINGLAFLAILGVLLVCDVRDFRVYIAAYTAASLISLLYRLFKINDILKAGVLPAGLLIKESFDSIRVGIKLMVANISAMLILGVARFAIDAHWGIEVFSYVSFALSIVSLFVTFISQASMVLFPALRQTEGEDQKRFFVAVRDGLDVLLPVVFLLYLPIAAFVNWWLPQYAESLRWLALFLPFCIFDGKMDIVGATFLKVLRGERVLLKINFLALVISLIGVALGIAVFDSAYVLLLFAVAAIVIRCIYAEHYVGKLFDAAETGMTAGLVALSVLFLLTVEWLSIWVGWVVMLVSYAIYLVCFRSKLRDFKAQFRALLGK